MITPDFDRQPTYPQKEDNMAKRPLDVRVASFYAQITACKLSTDTRNEFLIFFWLSFAA